MPNIRCRVSSPIPSTLSNPDSYPMADRSRRRRCPPPPPQFYDEETGAPIDGGCRRADCYFVHPSQAQWASARPSKNLNRDQGYQNSRGNGGGGGYGGRDRDGYDRGGGFGRREDPRPERTSSNAIPTGPGRQSNGGAGSGAGASSAAWGAPLQGSAWGPDNDAQGGTSTLTNTGAWPSSGNTDAQAAAPGGWGTTGDWGSAQNDWGASVNIPWGTRGASPVREPVAGGWGTGGGSAPAAKPGDGWGESPKKSPGRKDSTRSSFAEPAPPKDKGKAREVAMESPVGTSAQVGFYTPQFDFATPRTPRSPNRSPQDSRQDSHRKSSLAGAPSDDPGVAGRAARDVQRERETMRMSSLGIMVPTANAGAVGALSSRPNPFSFPDYTPAENMDVSRNVPEPGQVQEEQPVQDEDVNMVDEPARAHSPAMPSQALPVGLKSKWKDFTW